MAELADYKQYLDEMKIPLRLACKTRSGWPVSISLWYIHLDSAIYCATKDSARVIHYLDHNPECAFEIASDLPPYCGIRGQARAVLQRERGAEILKELIDRYLGERDNSLAKFLLKDINQEIAIRLEPVKVFQWDFSSRMQEITPLMLEMQQKSCP
jgi:nitroimidazol reductase NimA-like FMN-containing flavoprotein (pyridoxamine 5'-phosphate oxidase superfamily)